MVYYLDSDFCLHMADDGTMQQWEDAEGFFDGKCQTFVEGYRVVPDGQTWIREDGRPFKGEMITPWKPYNELAAAQDEYEKAQEEVSLLHSELAELDAALLETMYNSIINEV